MAINTNAAERKIHDNLNFVSFMKLRAIDEAAISRIIESTNAKRRIIFFYIAKNLFVSRIINN